MVHNIVVRPGGPVCLYSAGGASRPNGLGVARAIVGTWANRTFSTTNEPDYSFGSYVLSFVSYTCVDSVLSVPFRAQRVYW